MSNKTRNSNQAFPKIGYKFLNADVDEAEILIYDDIGEGFFTDGITAKDFAKALAGLGEVSQITVRINSVGGDVFDGNAIYNQLRTHKARKVVMIDGAALSAASVIAMAGDEIEMAANAVMMIHEPWSLAVGGADDMRKEAELLDTLRDGIASVYAARTGKSRDEINSLMADETWMDADEAVAMRFADRVGEAKRIAASYAPNMKIPARFAGMFVSANPALPGAPVGAEHKEHSMIDSKAFAAHAAEHQDELRAAASGLIEAATKEGHASGVKAERERAGAIADSGGDAKLIGDSIKSGATPQDAAIAAKDQRIAALEQKLAAAPKQTGVTITGEATAQPTQAEGPDAKASPKARAEWEFDNGKATWKARNRDNYVSVRAAELDGKIKLAS